MGLDMYCTKEIYVQAKYEHRNITGDINLMVNGIKQPIDLNQINSIELNVMYWRKANAIHNWFIKTVADGNDDCRRMHVSTEHLRDLRTLCQMIIDQPNLAESLLPTQQGFFFGSQEYNDWYFEYLKETVEAIDKSFAEDEELDDSLYVEYYYEASW